VKGNFHARFLGGCGCRDTAFLLDFGLNTEDQEVANRSLLQLKGQGVTVVFILMFCTHYAAGTTLPYVFCEKIEDLSRITLTAI